MQKKSNVSILFDSLLSFVMMFCLVRFSLVMTADISIFNLTYVIVLGCIAIAYFCLTNNNYRQDFLKMNFLFWLAYVLMIGIAFLLTVRGAYKETAMAYLKQLLILLLMWGMYVYLKNSTKKNSKLFVYLYLACMVVSAIYTSYVAFTGEEDIIRMTAWGEYNSSYPFVYGGFDFIYGLVLIYTALITVLHLRWRQISILTRIVVVLIEVLFAITITLSGYTTAFILILTYTIWQLLPKGIFRLLVSGLILILFFAIPNIIISGINLIPFIPEITSSRVTDVILSIVGGTRSEYLFEEGQRLSRVGWSMKIFFSNPLFGGFIGNTDLPFGYHTEWIDQLARYGLIATTLNVAFWIKTFRNQKNDTEADDASKICIRNCFLMFLVLGFLNPISMVVTVCPLFVVSPFIAKLLIDKEV